MKDSPIAKCYLKGNDDKNLLFLTSNYFFVRLKGKLHPYSIDVISEVALTTKQLVVPIVAGGIITSLSVVAYMNDIVPPGILMVLLISGILLLYYGFVGSPALTIVFYKNQEHYLLHEKNIYLESFIDFVNRYIKQNGIIDYFINIKISDWGKAQENGYIRIEQPLELMEKPIKKDSQILLRLDVQKLSRANIVYEISDHNQLKPYINEDISLTAVSIAG